MADFDSIFTEVQKCVVDVVECEPEEVKINTSLPDDLDVDSLMGLEISVKVQQKYKIKITPKETQKLLTPKLIIEKVIERLSQ